MALYWLNQTIVEKTAWYRADRKRFTRLARNMNALEDEKQEAKEGLQMGSYKRGGELTNSSIKG